MELWILIWNNSHSHTHGHTVINTEPQVSQTSQTSWMCTFISEASHPRSAPLPNRTRYSYESRFCWSWYRRWDYGTLDNRICYRDGISYIHAPRSTIQADWNKTQHQTILSILMIIFFLFFMQFIEQFNEMFNIPVFCKLHICAHQRPNHLSWIGARWKFPEQRRWFKQIN